MSSSTGRDVAAATAVGQGVEEIQLTDEVETTDGRSLRRRRNRDAVIRALVDLIHAGELDPTIDKVAERAAVSARSIFRYFTDLDDLARTAIETEMAAVMPIAVIPDRGEGDLEHRIEQLLAARRRLFVKVHRLFLVARRREHDISEIEHGLNTMATMLREQVRFQFATELDPLGDEAADDLAAMVSTAIGMEAFDNLRRRLGHTDAQIFESWRGLLRTVFG